jgi:hypothetical protein
MACLREMSEIGLLGSRSRGWGARRGWAAVTAESAAAESGAVLHQHFQVIADFGLLFGSQRGVDFRGRLGVRHFFLLMKGAHLRGHLFHAGFIAVLNGGHHLRVQGAHLGADG